ncbi:phosphogluconate dehydrogenase C-terminal domain-containing protein [Kribbella sp. NPDC048928]|uniref:phosphogluconate dehydrogenase C-terminal domain-containing protein n=1 Tax=Kribbella sp. NPDC048928 TaxID=3364111 RepID=UPI003711F43B
MSTSQETVVVVGAGGKMGLRVSANLARSQFRALYCEASGPGTERVRAEGRAVVPTADAVREADVVVLATPDTVLGQVSHEIVPLLKDGAVLLTLDPAAAYAGLLATRDGVVQAVAHPCHPSVFLERTTAEEWADTFGGVSAPQDVVAAVDDPAEQSRVEAVVRVIYGPVLDVHWVTVKQLAVLEPTLVETVACMVGTLLKEALHETVHTVGVPEAAARAILHGHIQIALTNALRGSNPFSSGCEIAIAYGHETIIKDDWKRIFDDAELDRVITRMLRLEPSTK